MPTHSRRPRRWCSSIVDVGAAMLLPIVEWFDDLTRLERLVATAKSVLAVVGVFFIVFALSACESGSGDSSTSVPTTTTRCEGDEPGWPCSRDDNSCDDKDF